MQKLTSRAFANGSSLTTGNAPSEFLNNSSNSCISTVSWYYWDCMQTQQHTLCLKNTPLAFLAVT